MAEEQRYDAQIATLTTVVSHGFESQQRTSLERHTENRERLRVIEALQRETNGRVTKHDTQIALLLKQHEENAKREPLTLKTAMQYITAVGAAIATTWWVLTVLLDFQRVP